MRPSVLIMMSTYNGEKYVSEQIVKLLNEKGIYMTEAQISALIETAYNTLKKTQEEKATMQLMQAQLAIQSINNK